MKIEPGDETTRLFRERGWTHWHHLFHARDLLALAIAGKHIRKVTTALVAFPKVLDNSSKLARWYIRGNSIGGSDFVVGVFYNQALNTMYNYANRSHSIKNLRFTQLIALRPALSLYGQDQQACMVRTSKRNSLQL